MNKYTASKKILYELREIRREPHQHSREYNFIAETLSAHLGAPPLPALIAAFWRRYDVITFCTPEPVKTVSLDGFHFPVSLFDIEEI